jgi:hypothetical protein
MGGSISKTYAGRDQRVTLIAEAPHRVDQGGAREDVRGRRQFLDPGPTHGVVFLRSDVQRRSLPFTNEPGAQDGRRIHRPCGESAQMRHRARGDLHSQLLLQLPGERVQLRLASLDETTRQVPHVWVGTLVRPPMHEKDTIFTNQRAYDDLMHCPTQPQTTDTRTTG